MTLPDSVSATLSLPGVPRRSAQIFRLERVRQFVRWFYHYRSLRLTPDGVRFLCLVFALGLAAINTGNNLLYLLLGMMLSIIVVSGVLSEKCLKGVSIARRMPPHLFVGRLAVGNLRVANAKRHFPSFSLKITDMLTNCEAAPVVHVLYLPPQATVSQSYRYVFSRRGAYRINTITLATRFPFGLFIKTATVPLATDVVVYPSPEPLTQELLQHLQALGHDRPTPRRGPGSALHNLRDYQSGDDSRAVHWKTSARHARLIVRETEAEDDRTVTIALPTVQSIAPRKSGDENRDTYESPEGFEHAVVLVASLAAHFHREGFAIRLLVGEEELPFGTGEVHLHRILRLLALCSAEGNGVLPPAFVRLADQTTKDNLTLLVLPWKDPALQARCSGVSAVLEAWR